MTFNGNSISLPTSPWSKPPGWRKGFCDKSKVFDPRELRTRLATEDGTRLPGGSNGRGGRSRKVAHFLNVILAAHPELLQKAQKRRWQRRPSCLKLTRCRGNSSATDRLPKSPRNIYGVIPASKTRGNAICGLAGPRCKRPRSLVASESATEASPVNVLLPDGRGFYPISSWESRGGGQRTVRCWRSRVRI